MKFVKIKSSLTLGILMFGLLIIPVTFGTPVLAASTNASKNEICQGIGQAQGSCSSSESKTLDKALASAINVLSIIAGVIAIIMVVISGIKFITSNGDSSSIASARTTLIYALAGLVIVAFAQAIVHFVLNKATHGVGAS